MGADRLTEGSIIIETMIGVEIYLVVLSFYIEGRR